MNSWRDQRGAYAILFAILIVLLFIMIAFAVDLSDARARVRHNQTRTDSAGLAAGAHLPDDPLQACKAAWLALLTNTSDLSGQSPCDSHAFRSRYDPDYAGFDASLGGCVPTTAIEYLAQGTDPYEVVFVYPVTDDVLQELSSSQGGELERLPNEEFEGEPCERFGVTMVTSQGALFGGIVGSAGISAPATSVVRGHIGTTGGDAVALLLLDPTGCHALRTGSENVRVQVEGFGTGPGRIALDSDGTASGNAIPGCDNANNYVLHTNNTPGTHKIFAGDAETGGAVGQIGMFALGGPGKANAYQEGDITSLRIVPRPRSLSDRITRAPWDHEYNCKASYPNYRGIPISGCVEADEKDAYIDDLRAAIGTSDNPGTYNRFTTSPLIVGPDDNPLAEGTGRCNRGSADPPLIVPEGNWWVDCSGGFSVNNELTEFLGGNIVFDGDVSVGAQGTLRINTQNLGSLSEACQTQVCITESSDDAAFVYIRGIGSLSKDAQGSLTLESTFVYINNGAIDIGAGAQLLSWVAPFEGPFENLALWSEGAFQHKLGGQANILVDGVFFLPNASPFVFTGQGDQDQTNAQFVSYRMTVDGQGVLKMRPDPDRIVSVPFSEWYLIR